MTPGSARDRDPDGRPRQSRPRDELGRPLPYGATGVEPEPEVALPPIDALARAWDLLDNGRPFAAHEVLEARWKAGPPAEAEFWQGLAQLCVGITHAERGNPVGARRLVERGAYQLSQYQGTSTEAHGADLPAWIDRARAALPPDEDEGSTVGDTAQRTRNASL